jgi:hypothetical protein
MIIRLIREPSTEISTTGILLINGVFECWTIEDVVREQKLPGETAIPEGRYRVHVNESQRFKRLLPLLLSVPGFSGVRIHPGNTAKDTEGCILPGTSRLQDFVGGSRVAFERMFNKIQSALARSEAVWMVIENSRG